MLFDCISNVGESAAEVSLHSSHEGGSTLIIILKPAFNIDITDFSAVCHPLPSSCKSSCLRPFNNAENSILCVFRTHSERFVFLLVSRLTRPLKRLRSILDNLAPR